MAPIVEGRLSGRIAVVTGAANGIGRASALRLAREGADLAVVDREGEALHTVGHAIEELGRQALALTADWTDAVAVREAFAAIRRRFGRIDILFNNVGQSARERASEFHLSEEETWRFVIEVSLLTTMRASRLAVEEMRARKSGRIVNMSTESAFYGDVGFVDYAAAKMGVVGFTRSLARELGDFGIRVNAIAPGFTLSGENEKNISAERKQTNIELRMLKRAEVPNDLVGTFVFLASDDSDFITGQTLLVDGGGNVH